MSPRTLTPCDLFAGVLFALLAPACGSSTDQSTDSDGEAPPVSTPPGAPGKGDSPTDAGYTISGPRSWYPPNFSETYKTRIHSALDHVDQFLASADLGPVVYATLSDLALVWPPPQPC